MNGNSRCSFSCFTFVIAGPGIKLVSMECVGADRPGGHPRREDGRELCGRVAGHPDGGVRAGRRQGDRQEDVPRHRAGRQEARLGGCCSPHRRSQELNLAHFVVLTYKRLGLGTVPPAKN